MLKIHIISAALPPDLDGIGDYTARVAAELSASAQIKVLTRQGAAPEPITDVEIEQVFRSDRRADVRAVASRVAADRPDWLLLQYNPFSYGRWGLNAHLPAAVARAKRLSARTRIALMVHEPFVPVSSWKFAIMTVWQRWQLLALGRAADLVFFSVEPWAKRFARWFPGKPVVHLPVASNVPRLDTPRHEARRRLRIANDEIVLGLFGWAHPNQMLNWVAPAARAASAAGPVRVLYLGPQKAVVRAAVPDVRLIADGLLPPDEVSRRLSAVDVFLCAFIDGVSTRRTSMMAALQHGLAIVGTRGQVTDSVLLKHHGRALLLTEVDDEAGFALHVEALAADPVRRSALGRAGRQLYDEQFASPLTAARLLYTFSTLDASGRCEEQGTWYREDN